MAVGGGMGWGRVCAATWQARVGPVPCTDRALPSCVISTRYNLNVIGRAHPHPTQPYWQRAHCPQHGTGRYPAAGVSLIVEVGPQATWVWSVLQALDRAPVCIRHLAERRWAGEEEQPKWGPAALHVVSPLLCCSPAPACSPPCHSLLLG